MPTNQPAAHVQRAGCRWPKHPLNLVESSSWIDQATQSQLVRPIEPDWPLLNCGTPRLKRSSVSLCAAPPQADPRAPVDSICEAPAPRPLDFHQRFLRGHHWTVSSPQRPRGLPMPGVPVECPALAPPAHKGTTSVWCDRCILFVLALPPCHQEPRRSGRQCYQ